ncbi:uncharacterized protein BDZ83DRAFT_633921 [Colletotrichum acutatum]|uniref:Uncharacterized protein n=1 Tax=Glomerella acutata TaxID=27357 RepID=A0AAD8XAT4_GLOAC|nr:uncharacterized protein BDZ83DRAFT_633921 [Colletotrichum acutatum]KAK1717392.1 hypothetical protein BDZ83DRAFT_633921 [Colletotrichum acutatum]
MLYQVLLYKLIWSSKPFTMFPSLFSSLAVLTTVVLTAQAAPMPASCRATSSTLAGIGMCFEPSVGCNPGQRFGEYIARNIRHEKGIRGIVHLLYEVRCLSGGRQYCLMQV